MTEKPVSERIDALLNYLYIERLHVAACLSADWEGLVDVMRHRVATLAIVAPHLNKGVPAAAKTFDRPTLVIAGEEGPPAERARSLARDFPIGRLYELSNYTSPIWADTVADRLTEVESALLDFWSSADAAQEMPATCFAPSAAEGNFEGIRYRIRGNGPPVMLLPLSFSPSQWEPLVKRLSDRFCTISLGGAFLGAVALLESRAHSGYGELVASVLDTVKLGPGKVGIEVGCGTGALSRGLLVRSDPTSQMVATDLNPYLLAEAKALAESDNVNERLRLEVANAARLQYRDDEFDLAVSCTVMEEGDANQMLAELVRVTKPGGRVVAVVRALDVEWWVGLNLQETLRRSINANGPKTGAGVAADGCADSSLYKRARSAGIKPLQIGPQFARYNSGERLDDVLRRLGYTLAEGDLDAFNDAVSQGRANNTLVVCEPFHCLVGEVG